MSTSESSDGKVVVEKTSWAPHILGVILVELNAHIVKHEPEYQTCFREYHQPQQRMQLSPMHCFTLL